MKKSLLALAVVAAATSANAATVYDKDGTSMYIDGRIQSVFFNGNQSSAAAVKDNTIKTTGRFGIGGKTQINDWMAGIAYNQWDVASSDQDSFSVRDQWVGLDFGDYGVLKFGRMVDATYQFEAFTDHYEECANAAQGAFNGARRDGMISYTYNNYGFYAQANLELAKNNARLWDGLTHFVNRTENKLGTYAIDRGAGLSLGYTFDDVLFGPLTFKAGYMLVKGQQGNDRYNGTWNAFGTGFDSFKHYGAGFSWGDYASGFYCGAMVEKATMTDIDSLAVENGLVYKQIDNKRSLNGFELILRYAFDNGVSVNTGYHLKQYNQEGDTAIGGIMVKQFKYTKRTIPVFVNYQMNSNFNVWGEVGFDAGSSKYVRAYGQDVYGLYTTMSNGVDVERGTVVSIGARYTF